MDNQEELEKIINTINRLTNGLEALESEIEALQNISDDKTAEIKLSTMLADKKTREATLKELIKKKEQLEGSPEPEPEPEPEPVNEIEEPSIIKEDSFVITMQYNNSMDKFREFMKEHAELCSIYTKLHNQQGWEDVFLKEEPWSKMKPDIAKKDLKNKSDLYENWAVSSTDDNIFEFSYKDNNQLTLTIDTGDNIKINLTEEHPEPRIMAMLLELTTVIVKYTGNRKITIDECNLTTAISLQFCYAGLQKGIYPIISNEVISKNFNSDSQDDHILRKLTLAAVKSLEYEQQ